jgi:hypothetical protein
VDDGGPTHCVVEDGVNDLPTVMGIEWLAGDLHRIGFFAPRYPIPRASHQKQEEWDTGQSFDQGREIFFGGSIDPVQVFYNQQERLMLTRTEIQVMQRLKRPYLPHLGAQDS